MRGVRRHGFGVGSVRAARRNQPMCPILRIRVPHSRAARVGHRTLSWCFGWKSLTALHPCRLACAGSSRNHPIRKTGNVVASSSAFWVGGPRTHSRCISDQCVEQNRWFCRSVVEVVGGMHPANHIDSRIVLSLRFK